MHSHHTQPHAFMHLHTHTHMHTHTYMHAHIDTHKTTLTHIHTCMHTPPPPTHTHTHTHPTHIRTSGCPVCVDGLIEEAQNVWVFFLHDLGQEMQHGDLAIHTLCVLQLTSKQTTQVSISFSRLCTRSRNILEQPLKMHCLRNQ